MGFIGREAFIKPVDLQVFVLVVRAALDASLRKFDMLQRGNLYQCLYNSNNMARVRIVLCEAC